MKKFKLIKLILLSTVTAQLVIFATKDFVNAEEGLHENNLAVEYKCLDSSLCIELNKDMEILLNNIAYKPTTIDYDNKTLYYTVPEGNYEYSFTFESNHAHVSDRAETVVGTVDIGNADYKLDMYGVGKSTSTSIKLVPEYIDIDGTIVPSTINYNGKLELVRVGGIDKVSVDIVNNQGQIDNIQHGTYDINLEGVQDIEEKSAHVIYTGKEIVINTKMKSSIIDFKFNETNEEPVVGKVKGTLVNTVTNARKDIELDISNVTQIRIPYGTYILENLESNAVKLATDSINIVASEVTQEVDIDVTKVAGSIEIINLQSDGQPIPNSEFEIKGNGLQLIGTTDDNGKLYFSGLELGTYEIKQLGSGSNSHMSSADVITVDLSKSNTQSLEVINSTKATSTVTLIPNIDNIVMQGKVSVRIQGLSPSNSFIDMQIETTGENPTSIELYPGEYSIILEETSEAYPVSYKVENTLLASSPNDNTNVTWNLNYTNSKGRSSNVPQTSRMARGEFGIFGGLSLLALSIYWRSKKLTL